MKFLLRITPAAALLCLAASTPAQTPGSGSIKLTCPGTTTPTEIPLADGAAVSIDSDGNLVATAANCDTLSATTAEVTVDPLKLSSATVEQGQGFTATIGSLGARTCERTSSSGTSSQTLGSGWDTAAASPRLSDQTIGVTVGSSAEPGTYTLTHICHNGDISSAPATATLKVVASSTSSPPPDTSLPAGCDAPMRPGTWTRDDTAIAGDFQTQTLTWEQVYGSSFPAGASRNLAANRDRFIALEFDPSSLTAGKQGIITAADMTGQPSGVGTAVPVFSLSTCPGDFRSELGNTCRTITSGSIQWTTNSADTARCLIDRTQTRYFLNIAWANVNDPSDPTGWFWWCDGSSDECGKLITSSSN